MLRAFDHEVSRWHGASHASQLVLRLGPGLDADVLRQLIEKVTDDAPIVRATIRRPRVLLAPIYDLQKLGPVPPLRIRHLAEVQEPAAVFSVALNEMFAGARGELLRFDLVQYADGTADLALTWLHMLLDGSGSEEFVRALVAVSEGRVRMDLNVGRSVPNAELTFRERGDRARRWQGFLSSFATKPPTSLAGPLRRCPQKLSYQVTSFTAEETRQVEATAKEKAGFLTPVIFYMAAAIRAHHHLFEARGAIPLSYVVPLPVNTRPKGASGAIFRTHVSMVWFQVVPKVVDDFDALLNDLKTQRRDAVRKGLIESGACAIDFARFVPAGLFSRMVRRTLGGEICSFFFAYTGNFLAGVEEFLGAEIRSGFHVPAVPPSPGSCAAMSIHRGRLNLTHVYQEGAVSGHEVSSFAAHMRRELLRG